MLMSTTFINLASLRAGCKEPQTQFGLWFSCSKEPSTNLFNLSCIGFMEAQREASLWWLSRSTLNCRPLTPANWGGDIRWVWCGHRWAAPTACHNMSLSFYCSEVVIHLSLIWEPLFDAMVLLLFSAALNHPHETVFCAFVIPFVLSLCFAPCSSTK